MVKKITISKRDREKLKEQKRKEKQQRKEERQSNGPSSFEDDCICRPVRCFAFSAAGKA